MPNIKNQSKNISLPFNKVIEDFAQATDFASVLVDIHGIENSRLYNFTSFCNKIRHKKEFRSLCQKCDMHGGLEASKTGSYHIYRCHAGLTDISFPVIQQNQLSGFLQIGQVRLEESFQSKIPAIQAFHSNWSNDPDLRKEYDKIPEISQKKLQSTIKLLEQINIYHQEDEKQKQQITFDIKKTKTKKENTEIQHAVDYIQKNITKNISLEEVASHVYLSQYYFSKLFKKEMSVNFSTYLNQQKIERAKIFLQNGSLSIETIAHNLGFSHSSYFCKLFKTIVGVTPATYRKANFCKILIIVEQNILIEKNIHLHNNETLINILKNNFKIKIENEFITEIENYKQDRNRNLFWTFTINNKFVYQSVTKIKPQANDFIIFSCQAYLL